MEEDSQSETSIKNPEKFKPINWVQWPKEFENYVALYKTTRKSVVYISYVTRNTLKMLDVAAMALLPQTEKEYCNITLNNRNRRYVEDSKRVYSILEDLMLDTDGYEWLGEVAMRDRNGKQSFANLQTHYYGPGENLKQVAKANYILENIHYKNEITAFNFEVCVTRIKDSYKILKDNVKVHHYSQKVQKLIRGIHSDAHSYLHTAGGIVKMDTSLNNYFNLAVDSLSQYLSTRSHNVDFIKRNPKNLRNPRNLRNLRNPRKRR